MPKITGYLSSAQADPRSSLEPHAGYMEESSVLRALGNTDNAYALLAQAGKGTLDLGVKGLNYIADLERLKEASDSQIEGVEKLGELYKTTLNDRGNYGTAEDRYKAGSKTILDGVLDKISDPQAKQSVSKALGMYRVQHSVDLSGHVLEYKRKMGEANLLSNLERLTDDSAKHSLGDNGFNTILKMGSSQIVAYGVALGMDPVAIQKLDRKFRGDLSRTQVLRIMNSGDTGPQQAVDMMMSGALPHLEPDIKEILINTASRRQQAIYTQQDTRVRQQLAQAEYYDKKLTTDTEKWQETNAAALGVLINQRDLEGESIASTDKIRGLIAWSVKEGKINAKGERELNDRLHRNIKEEMSTLSHDLYQTFGNAGPMDKIDPAVKEYVVKLTSEAKERLQKGEKPHTIYQSIVDRERRTVNRPPTVYPSPSLLSGDKENADHVMEAGKRTVAAIEKYQKLLQEGKTPAEARKLGGMDPVTGRRELKNAEDLIKSINNQNKVIKENMERDKKKDK